MPVYNSSKYLDEAIQSILNQSYKNFEFIIVNNNSTDNSLDIINKYLKTDSRIKIYTENKKGISNALNTAINHTSGDYIFRMDSDDIAKDYRIEETLAYMFENDLDICGSYIEKFNKTKIKLIKYPTPHISISLSIDFCTPFAHPTVCFNKRILKHIIYEDTLAEDWNLWRKLKIINEIKFGNVPKSLLYYRTDTNSLVYQNKLNFYNVYNKKQINSNLLLIKSFPIPVKDKYFIISNYIGNFPISKYKKIKFYFYFFKNLFV